MEKSCAENANYCRHIGYKCWDGAASIKCKVCRDDMCNTKDNQTDEPEPEPTKRESAFESTSTTTRASKKPEPEGSGKFRAKKAEFKK